MANSEKMTKKNLVMYRGDTKRLRIKINGLTDIVDSIFFSCKSRPKDVSYAFQKSLDNGITYEGDGVYNVKIIPDDTNSLSIKSYFYDLQLSVNSDVFTVLSGTLKILEDITRE